VVHDIACQNLNVTICVDRAGIVGADGETHQGVFDVSFLNHIPNISIVSARNIEDLIQCMDFSAHYKDGPLVIRYPRGNDLCEYTHKVKKVYYGKSEWLETGEEIAIVFTGTMYEEACKLKGLLKKSKYNPSLINGRFIKPIDTSMIKKVAKTHAHMVILEENMIIGGYGSEILRYIYAHDIDLKIHLFGIDDEYVSHGNRDQLIKDCKIDAENIKKRLLKRIGE
jgi:1-deoxy-D-xylulose-5-phosphate synthase